VKPVRVDERDAVFLPVRVCRLHRLSADALACLAECVRATEIQDEQAVRGVGPRCSPPVVNSRCVSVPVSAKKIPS
jgi:hypothetical protein